jgi:hypothetical protein
MSQDSCGYSAVRRMRGERSTALCVSGRLVVRHPHRSDVAGGTPTARVKNRRSSGDLMGLTPAHVAEHECPVVQLGSIKLILSSNSCCRTALSSLS